MTDSPDLQLLKVFIKGLRDFMGRGGSRSVAESIHMQESAFSKFISDNNRGFDEKTFYSMGLMTQMRNEPVPDGSKLVQEGQLGPILFQQWETPAQYILYTWRPVDEQA